MKKKKENKKELDLNDWEILKNENEDEKKEEKKRFLMNFYQTQIGTSKMKQNIKIKY